MHYESSYTYFCPLLSPLPLRLIKRLVTLRPAQIPRRVFKAVRRLVGDLVEADVKQESVATLSLYRWLSDFTRLASVA